MKRDEQTTSIQKAKGVSNRQAKSENKTAEREGKNKERNKKGDKTRERVKQKPRKAKTSTNEGNTRQEEYSHTPRWGNGRTYTEQANKPKARPRARREVSGE